MRNGVSYRSSSFLLELPHAMHFRPFLHRSPPPLSSAAAEGGFELVLSLPLQNDSEGTFARRLHSCLKTGRLSPTRFAGGALKNSASMPPEFAEPR
jgi:hypothetical protein